MAALLLAVLLLVAAVNARPPDFCHLDLLVDKLVTGRLGEEETKALGGALAAAIAKGVGIGPEDVMHWEGDHVEHRTVGFLSGNTVLEFLPDAWPARLDAYAYTESALINGILKYPRSNLFLLHGVLKRPDFQQEVLDSIREVLGESSAITGELQILESYAAPFEESQVRKVLPLKGSTGRHPWKVQRNEHSGSGIYFPSGIVVFATLCIFIIASVAAGFYYSRLRRQRERQESILGMFSYAGPGWRARESCGDSFTHFFAGCWKRPHGGYGLTGH